MRLQWLACLLLLVPAKAPPPTLGFDHSTALSTQLSTDFLAQRLALERLRDTGASRVKIYNADRELIFNISSVWGERPLHLMIAVSNGELAHLARGHAAFDELLLAQLVQTVAMFPDRIEFIAVGNEVEYPESNSRAFAPLLLPVLETLHKALVERGLAHVRLTSPFSDMLLPDEIAVVGPSQVQMFPESYDSAQGCNDPSCMDHHRVPLMRYLLPVMGFFNRTNGAFTMSLYPFFKWRNLQAPTWCRRYGPCSNVSLAFAVGAPGAEPLVDSVTGKSYTSLLAAGIDAVRLGLARHGFPDLPLIIGETGWPTGGLADPGADAAASCHYVNSLFDVLRSEAVAESGLLQAYLFQWTDEEGKWALLGRPTDPGLIEDHWGVLDTRLRPKFNVDWRSGRATCPPLVASQSPSPTLAIPLHAWLLAYACLLILLIVAGVLHILRLAPWCKQRADTVEPLLAAPWGWPASSNFP